MCTVLFGEESQGVLGDAQLHLQKKKSCSRRTIAGGQGSTLRGARAALAAKVLNPRHWIMGSAAELSDALPPIVLLQLDAAI